MIRLLQHWDEHDHINSVIPYFFSYKTGLSPAKNNQKNPDLSNKMDLEF